MPSVFTFARGMSTLFLGDSITVDVNLGGYYRPLVSWAQARYPQSPQARFSKSPGGLFVYSQVVETAGPTFITGGSGISGGTTSDIIANWSTLVTPFEPFDCIIIELGINDWRHSFSNATIQANVNTIMSAPYAGQFTTKNPVLWVGPMCGDIGNGEDWSQFVTAGQLALDSACSTIQTAVLANGGVYADIRTPFKSWEQAGNNPSHLGQGIMTVDGVHPGPTDGQPQPVLGQFLMCDWMLPSVAFA
jgi:hypothetical protein